MSTSTYGQGREDGLRASVARKAICDLLDQKATPLTAAEILESLKKDHPRLHKTTVYRELEALSEMTLLTRVYFADGLIRYESPAEHHHHLVCTSCKKTIDLRLQDRICDLAKGIAKDHGFKRSFHIVEFFGLCSKCQ